MGEVSKKMNEVINAVHVAINRKRIEETIGYEAISYITSLEIELRAFDDLIKPTFQMARRFNISPCDCAYMSLAEREKCDFLTGDRRLFNVIRNQFPLIKWIGDYPSRKSIR